MQKKNRITQNYDKCAGEIYIKSKAHSKIKLEIVTILV